MALLRRLSVSNSRWNRFVSALGVGMGQCGDVAAGSTESSPAVKTLTCLQYEYTEGMLEKRAPYRMAHLKHAQDAVVAGTLTLGGAYGDLSGALLVFNEPDAAKKFAKADPYVLNELVTKWSVKPWSVVAGTLYGYMD